MAQTWQHDLPSGRGGLRIHATQLLEKHVPLVLGCSVVAVRHLMSDFLEGTMLVGLDLGIRASMDLVTQTPEKTPQVQYCH